MNQEDITDQITAACSQPLFHNQDLTVTDQDSAPQQPSSDIMSSQSKWVSSSTEDTDLVVTEDGLSNGTCEIETMVALHCPGDSGDVTAEGDHLALSNDGMSEFSNSDLSLPEVCISTNSNSFEEDMNYEVQQAYRIFTGFLLEKHKGITSPFLHPIGHQEAQHGIGGVRGWGQAQLRQSMCLRRMEEKFINQEYETITEFVADFRLMLENCYRYHGVDHWISKQAQKLEIMLEQKLTLLSRTLREKTTLAVTSKGRFGAEEERGSGGTSTRRRLAPRSLATITVGGHESIMVQTLRLEEQQRAKDEKRQRELEKKEAEEMSAKEVEEWEQTLLSQASPHTVDTLWELPAVGHFLCLAQTALNLPEIVFFELERCLLMPRCSPLLSKIMSSLLSPPQRRATLHRRPALPYRRWESELRQRVLGWYRAVGASHDQPGRAEQMGLCHQFFSTLGEVSPLEEKPFHLLPFYQRVWLLKGLCDHVYETQKDVQDALLSQPIHECRESILGYDSKENAYIHFPHFCGADLRIYCQSPSMPPAFPFPSVWVKKVEIEPGTEGEESDGMKDEGVKSDKGCYGGSMDTGESDDFGNGTTETLGVFKGENGDGEEEDKNRLKTLSLKKEEGSESGSSDGDSCDDSQLDLKIHSNFLSLSHTSPIRGGGVEMNLKEDTVELEHQSSRLMLKQEQGFSLDSMRTIKAETQEPCLSVGEHSYTGRSPARLVSKASPTKSVGLKVEEGSLSQGHQRSSCLECCKNKTSNFKSEEDDCYCGTSGLATQLSSESAQNSSEERVNDKIWTKKKKRKKKRGREQLPRVKGEHKQLQHEDRMRLSPAEAAKSAVRRVATTIKRKDKKKKHKTGKKLETLKKIKDEPPVEPSFKLVCTSLEDLRELISKTEDELDDLESTRKRLGRWYYRREAVKDLHSTLIRLLNELSPWEPKLAKAFQRNRLRLKKEFDDFKKHPEYSNFVREECISSSSSSDDDEERSFGKEVCSFSDHYRRSEEEDLEHMVPRGLWSGASTREFVAESAEEKTVTYVPPNHLKHHLASTEKGVSLLSRVQTGSSNISSTANPGPQSRSELIPSNQSRDSNSAWAAKVPAQASPSSRPPILHPTTGLPKGYTPIPTLLAKSVGNKVTLMKRPADYPGVNIINRQSKGSLVSLPTSAVTTAKLSKAQSSPSSSQQNSQQTQAQGLQQTEFQRQPGMATATAALPKSPQAKPTQAVPKNPVQVVYKVPERLGHIVRTDSSSPVKISVHPVVDQSTGEKIMQQVVILPSNLLIHKTDEKASSSHQQQSKGIQVPVSKVASPLCMSTNVPGFTIPENRIPVQQVAPLKDARTLSTPSPSVSPRLQQGAMNTAGINRAQVCSPQASTTQGIMPNPSPITAPSSAISTEPLKSTDPKQELKTVCIRDSQSILVTTRGGNTGIVKVQTSSDQNALGSLPTSSVITISPQFKAFLVSKTSPTLSPSAPSQTSPCTTPAVTSISVTQPQKQVPSVLKSPSTVATPMLTAVTGSIPVTGSGSTTVAVGQGSNTSPGSTVTTKIGQLAQTAVAGSHFQASVVKSTVVVPSLSSSGVPQVLTPAEFISKTGVKRASTDERSQVTKFILVTPSSSSTSNVALSKGTPSSTKSLPSSRVVFISQPTATSSTTSMGSIPKQAIATGASGQLLTTSLSSQTLKMGLSLGQPVGGVTSETLAKVKNITLPSGVQIQLSGKTTTIGQTIGALSRSPSKSTPVSVSDPGRPTVAIPGLVPVTSSNTITSCSAQLSSRVSLTTSSQLQGIPSFTMISQPGSSTSTSTAATLTAGNVIKKDLGISPNILSSNSPAQVTTTLQSITAQTSTPTLVHQPSNIQSGTGEETTSHQSFSQLAVNKIQTPISSATTTNTQFTTSATGTIQQRIVINTSTPLAAGTQILLNNARFVVPPQGLGPGSHVLIISSPAPQQVPTASATSTGASVPPQGASHATVAPRAPVLSQSPARLPGVPAVSCPFVACTPAVGPSLLAATPNATPGQLTGTPGLGSTLLPIKTNAVSALPRFPAVQAGNFASPPVGTPTLLSSPPRLGSVPALVSPVVTSAPALGSALATVRLAAGTPTRGDCSSIISPVVAPPLSSVSAPLSSLPVLPRPTVPTALTSVAAPVVAGTPALHSSLPAQQVGSVTTLGQVIQPQQTAVGIAAPSTVLSQALVHTGLDNTSIKKTVPAVMQPVLAGTRTQVLPTVAVPPIVSAVSRMQTLPIATVTPIGSTVNTFETAPVVTTHSSSSTVIITQTQPITSLKTNNTIHPPVFLTSQAIGSHSLQTSSLGMHTSVASKLLVSPDGAVLNTVQCQVNPAELTACPKPLDALVVSPNSSTGALHTHDSSLQPSQAVRKCTN
ncbi:putative bromodomain-containing protein 10 [Chaetodon auriga]|uniref:putative bromodomain-containing protein 10 n=1 Tax=Chaetodon auriga TaxID=39042 RepID=UPI004032C7E9